MEKKDLQTISNEFAAVRFGKVTTSHGDRLLLETPSGDEQVLLDPVILEAIISLGHEEYSRLVELVRN